MHVCSAGSKDGFIFVKIESDSRMKAIQGQQKLHISTHKQVISGNMYILCMPNCQLTITEKIYFMQDEIGNLDDYTKTAVTETAIKGTCTCKHRNNNTSQMPALVGTNTCTCTHVECHHIILYLVIAMNR